MLKVMIVDDEILVRTGMKTLVNWESNGFQLVAEAGNGEEALQILSAQAVDIVITDIRMPLMDGLKLIEEIRNRETDCGMIVLSSYDEFQYVKKAMVLGARDYIHKPTMMPEDIVQSLKRVQEELEKKRAENRHKIASEQDSGESRQMLLGKIAKSGLSSETLPESLQQMVHDKGLADRTYTLLMLKLLYRDGIDVGDISRLRGEAALRETFEHFEATETMPVCWVKEESYWMALTESPEAAERLMHALTEAVTPLDGMSLLSERSESPCPVSALAGCIGRAKRRLDEEYRRQDWLQSVNPLIAPAMAYIGQHYTHELTLEDVARHVHINPTYMSRLFQKETDKTFIEYLTDLRMRYARKLLRDTGLTVGRIAEQVGYQNEKYFMKLFKKHHGCTPCEFRES